MQKYFLIPAAAFALVACTRSNPSNSQATTVDTLSRDYIVSTYSANFKAYQTPEGLCIDQNGIIYASNSAGWILKIPDSNAYSALDTLDRNGAIFVADEWGDAIRKIVHK